MNNIDIANLKGESLKAKAAELGIKGRSKMNADELRVAIANHLGTIEAEPRMSVAELHAKGMPEIRPEVVTKDNSAKLASVANQKLIERMARDLAGHASPMDNGRRMDIYSNGGARRITSAQGRRLRKAENKARG